jgi:2-keto-4-pentenoate hydratase/2-oxohepta-3-ene-1,7-dioic acid hydratase in catechol pathway
MNICRVRFKDRVLYAVLDGDRVIPIDGSIFADFTVGGEPIPLSGVQLLAPVGPSKIVAVGLNYKDHAMERGKPLPEEPLLFIKPSTAVIGPGDSIIYPHMSKRVDYEGELAVVIKRRASQLCALDPIEPYILGYTCLNDVTARDLQDKDKQFTRAKSFDTFAPIGPWIVTDLDPSALDIKTYLNGKLRQSSNTRHLIFSVPDLIRFVSNVMTLQPGDVITTGTPAGIGPMAPGDEVDVEIQGIGKLTNRVMRLHEE